MAVALKTKTSELLKSLAERKKEYEARRQQELAELLKLRQQMLNLLAAIDEEIKKRQTASTATATAPKPSPAALQPSQQQSSQQQSAQTTQPSSSGRPKTGFEAIV